MKTLLLIGLLSAPGCGALAAPASPSAVPSPAYHNSVYWAALGLSPVCIDPATGQAALANGGLKPGWSRTATGYEPNNDPLPVPWPCVR